MGISWLLSVECFVGEDRDLAASAELQVGPEMTSHGVRILREPWGKLMKRIETHEHCNMSLQTRRFSWNTINSVFSVRRTYGD